MLSFFVGMPRLASLFLSACLGCFVVFVGMPRLASLFLSVIILKGTKASVRQFFGNAILIFKKGFSCNLWAYS